MRASDFLLETTGDAYSLPSVQRAQSLMPRFLKAAQSDYEAWDESNVDQYAGGGICHIIADSICGVLIEYGIDCTPVSCNYQQHVYVAAKFAEGVYTIDIPYWIYEEGGGFSWRKLPDVVFEPRDVVFYRVSSDPEEFDNYISENVAVFESDKKFIGFMNKALGTQVDKPVYQQNKSEVMGLHNMPGYSKALDFGLKVIRAMDSETQLHFAQADDHEFLQYLVMLAKKKRYIPRIFVEEDLEEVDTVFDEVFHDPDMIGWTWADLLRDHIGVPVRAINRASALAHIERQRQADIAKTKGPKPISLDLLYVNEPHHKKPDAEIWYSNQDGTARVVASGYKNRAEAEAALARLKKDPNAVDIIKHTPSGPRKFSDPGPGIYENFADGRKPGRKGLAKRMGINCKQPISKLRSIAANSSGERQRMAHWCANMKSGQNKK